MEGVPELSPSERLARELTQAYRGNPARLARFYANLSLDARHATATHTGDNLHFHEQERRELYAALEQVNDAEFSSGLIRSLSLMGNSMAEDSLLLIGAYLERGLWTLDMAAPFLKPYLLPVRYPEASQRLRVLAAGAICDFASERIAYCGQEFGSRLVEKAMREADLPMACVENPSEFMPQA